MAAARRPPATARAWLELEQSSVPGAVVLAGECVKASCRAPSVEPRPRPQQLRLLRASPTAALGPFARSGYWRPGRARRLPRAVSETIPFKQAYGISPGRWREIQI